jgi:hypothetical protein
VEALNNNTSGGYNISIGQAAMAANQTGNDSTAIGASALFDATSGPNDAIGYTAGNYISTGTANVAIGYGAMTGVAATPLTANGNTAVGNIALHSIQGTAAGNTALGYQAGYSGTALTTGSNNVYIGYNAAASGAADTNEIVIGEGATGGGSNTATIGNSSIAITYIQGSAIFPSINSTSFLTSPASTTSTSLTTTGLQFPVIPASTNGHGRCTIIWEGASTSATAEFGITNSNTATAMYATSWSVINGSQTSATTGDITTAATTNVTGTITPAATNTPYAVTMDVTIETGSSANTLTIYYKTSSASHSVTIEPASVCGWLP